PLRPAVARRAEQLEVSGGHGVDDEPGVGRLGAQRAHVVAVGVLRRPRVRQQRRRRVGGRARAGQTERLARPGAEAAPPKVPRRRPPPGPGPRGARGGSRSVRAARSGSFTTAKSPVERSSVDAAAPSPFQVTAAIPFGRRASRRSGATIVPGVTIRTIFRATRVRPFAGASVCSLIATFLPAATSLARYGSSACCGMPHIGASTSL